MERPRLPWARSFRWSHPPSWVVHVSARRLRLPVLLAATTLAAGPLAWSASAQVIHGTVVDAATGDVVAAAYVAILDTAGVAVGGGATGADGRFVVRAPRYGVYRLRASQLGYDGLLTEVVGAGPGGELSLLLRMRPSPVDIPSLTVEANRRVARLEAVGFYQRRAMGFGHYLTPEQIVARNASYTGDLLQGLAGIRVIGDLGRQIVLTRASMSMFVRGPCAPSVVVDGYPVVVGGIGGPVSLDQLVAPQDIEALEVYPGPAGVPVQYSGYMSPCGAIVIWTRR